ncbi:hypothetical protein F4802DRAFT_429704 [Xylaria palmicola]|nr:hypothetical protein F4802DRAFT_429704 [Xylaria palmicola]
MAVTHANSHLSSPSRAIYLPGPSNLHAPVTAPATITPHVPVSLTRHSLNSVVACDKSLWQPPLKWTSTHLSALGIRRSRRRYRRRPRDYQPSNISNAVANEEDENSSDTDDECNYEGGGKGGERGDENYYVDIPDLTPARLGQYLAPFLGAGLYETRAGRLLRLLRWMPQQPCSTIVGCKEKNGDHERRKAGVLGRRFSFRWMTPQLIVGPRKYKLHFLFHLLLNDALVLPYVHSTCVLRSLSCVHHRRDLTRPYKPFIAAVLIGLAQSSVQNTAQSATDSLITTRLLFTHHKDIQDMYVYTAHISHALLDRFQCPNQPPIATTEPLIQLHYRRVPYEPQATFRHRLLAAVSITAIVEPNPEADPGGRSPCVDVDYQSVHVNPGLA